MYRMAEEEVNVSKRTDSISSTSTWGRTVISAPKLGDRDSVVVHRPYG